MRKKTVFFFNIYKSQQSTSPPNIHSGKISLEIDFKARFFFSETDADLNIRILRGNDHTVSNIKFYGTDSDAMDTKM